MKKTWLLGIVIFAIASCFVFSACDSKYASLSMSFYLTDGSAATSLTLVVNGDEGQQSTTLGVKFDGIDAEDIGDVTIKSSPTELATVSNQTTDGAFVYVNITANMAGSGQIVVQHLSSGKSASISLTVEKKSTDLTLNSANYIVIIPDGLEAGETSYSLIDSGSLVTLSPSGSTDKVYYKLSDTTTSISGVSLEYQLVNGERLISGFNVSSSVAEGATLTLYPVTTMSGFENTSYSAQEVTFIFLSQLTASDLYIKTDELHQDYLDNDATIYLIANDQTSVKISDESETADYSFDTFSFVVKQQAVESEEEDGEEGGTEPTETLPYMGISEYYSQYYTISYTSSSDSILIVNTGEKIVIQAVEYTAKAETITITFSPINCVGELQSFTKTIYVKGELKAEDISVSMQGETLSSDGSAISGINLYDYYATSGNALGALFNFSPLTETSYSDTKSMRISVSIQVLYAYLTTADEELAADYKGSKNPICTDSTCTTIATSATLGAYSGSVGSNLYVLVFYLNGNPMRFYFDTQTNAFISEEITEDDDVYIRYVETDSTNTNDYPLSLTVETYYTGELTYLATISGVSKTITFNRQTGVASMTVNAGTYDSSSGINLVQSASGAYDVKTIYLNTSDTDAQYVLYVNPTSVLDSNNQTITSAVFTVSVTGVIGDDLLTILQYNNTLNLSNLTGKDSISFSTNQSDTLTNAILLIFGEDTEVGEYTITFSCANGYSYEVKAYVYKKLTADDITYELATSDTVIANSTTDSEGTKSYTYEGYAADYIVASGQSIDIKTIVDDIFIDSVVTGYSFSAAWSGSISYTLSDYFTITYASNLAVLKFLKGTYFEDSNNYIVLTLSVETASFSNIITKSDSNDNVMISLVFFIYDEISDSDISLVTSVGSTGTFTESYTATVYMYEYLGAYDKDLSLLDIKFLLNDENLWNYVQSAQQSDAYNVGVSTVEVDDETGEGNTITVSASYNVIWYTTINSDAGAVTTLAQTEDSISLRFRRASNAYYYDIYAEIQQFGTTHTLRCRVVVQTPIITEQIKLITDDDNEIYTYSDTDTTSEGYYINLKAGQSYTFQLESVSSLGTVTNASYYIIVVDSTTGAKNTYSTTINGLKITAGEKLYSSSLTIIIFAKDALLFTLDETYEFDLDSLADQLMEGDQVSYSSAYLVIDLILSDGSATNPYLIQDADDFYSIKDYNSSYFKIMNDINLTASQYTNIYIDTFSGGITTYNDNTYSVYGFTLSSSNLNLFGTLSGSIKNVNFIVTYNYVITSQSSANDYYLGVIQTLTATGSLTNVTVSISGQASFNNSSKVYFGGLVGLNQGTITLTDSSAIGSTGSITLNGSAGTYFGGLVGANEGSITGYDTSAYQSGSSGVSFDVFVDDAGAVASINITSNLSNSSTGGVGGVIGYNNSGSFNTGYVTGSISATSSSVNVGGVIGYNTSTMLSTTIVMHSDAYISTISIDGSTPTAILNNITSSVQISAPAANNVGGLVGYSSGGYFTNLKYQILASAEYGIDGNYYVGGIVGYAVDAVIQYASVMSYRWDYNLLAVNDENASGYNDYESFASSGSADISGTDYVAGIIGGAVNSLVNNGSGALTGGKTYTDVKTNIVLNSSVNSYIYADTTNAGGIISNINLESTKYVSILYNGYFLGKVATGDASGLTDVYEKKTNEGNDYYFIVSNDGYTEYETVYTINADGNTMYAANFYHVAGGFSITDSTAISSISGWAYSDELNGGYAYLVDASDNPLFEIAPTSLSVTGATAYLVDQDEVYTNLIHLDYYSFNLDESAEDYEDIYDALTEKYNTYSIKYDATEEPDGIAVFEWLPESLRSVRLKVSTSKSSVIRIQDSNIVVCGVGQAVLTFTSVLNSSIMAQLVVNVSYPVGSSVVISESMSDASKSIDGSTQNITSSHAKLYYVISTGSLTYKGQTYTYQAESDIYLRVSVAYEKDDSESADITVADYINVSGVTAQIEDGETVFYVDPDTPFNVQVLQYLEGYTFNLSVQMYTVDSYDGQEFKTEFGEEVTFNVVTYKGASDLSLSAEEVVLYPNDTTLVKLFIETDIALSDSEIAEILSIYVQLIKEDGTTLVLDESYISDFVTGIQMIGYSAEEGIQRIYYTITFSELSDALIDALDYDESSELTLKIFFELSNGVNRYVEFTLLPQMVTKIELKNYVYTSTGSTDIELSDVLRPTGLGLMIIDIVPINGYFDYLEISDVTGNEEIVFYQIDGIAGARISEMDAISSDGNGIKLVKTGDSTIYVATFISSTYSSKTHTVAVTAYLADGTKVSDTFYYSIEVKMLPSVEVKYVDPNGDTVFDITSTSTDTNYLANGVDANFYIYTHNSDGDLSCQMTLSDGSDSYDASAYLNLREVRTNYYVLEFTADYDDSLLGMTLTISLTTTATQTNGEYETATTSFSFTIVRYVVHNVSVTSSTITSAYGSSFRGEIYGDYGSSKTLTFYFDKTDISYYNTDTKSFWDTTYTYADLNTYYGSIDLDTNPDIINNAVYQIYCILRALNTDTTNGNSTQNQYLTVTFYDDDNNSSTDYSVENVGSITGNTILLYSGHATLDINFTLYLDSENYLFTILYDSEETYLGGVDYSSSYYVDFVKASSFEEPTVIYTEEEFLSMDSGDEQYYILATNLVLTDYTPIDVDIRSFDGNGYSITIKNFDLTVTDTESASTTLSLGLFAEIYEDMMVLNLKVIYAEGCLGNITTSSTGITTIEYKDVTADSDVDYSAFYFGGVSPVNNGIISNCEVSGAVAVSASTIESKSSNYSVDIYLGGIVSDNASTGYITNSTSYVQFAGILNVGGVAYSNEGKIASTAFDGGMINAYNNSVSSSIAVNVAGFAVTNSGTISMSYVDLETVNISGSTVSALAVKDTSAGFVLTNSGSIYDCYVDILSSSGSNNTFSGFVYTNTGDISTCYTYINEGSYSSTEVKMFAPEGTTGITDCYEIVGYALGYSNKIDGLTTINDTAYLQDAYYGFIFGDNTSAVWSITAGSLPKLVSTQEKVSLSGSSTTKTGTDADGNSTVTYSGGLRSITRTTIVTEEDGHAVYEYVDEVNNAGYGSSSNPYLIYDADSWIYYFSYNQYGYFRLITDIDFESSTNSTSDLTVSGNIQGNNMTVSNYYLYSSSALESIGLFKELVGTSDISIDNAVRNLTLKPTSILASRVSMVGALAGLVEDFNLYNITIDADSLILVGGNAVGGVAGVVRGEFDISGISSNVGVNSNRVSSTIYSNYISVNNGMTASYNISSVYYAGIAFGILDGYSSANYNINTARNLVTNNYYSVSYVSITGSTSALGDTVGGAFGLVGESVIASDINVSFSGAISGSQYSGGIAGENRGVIKDSTFTSDSTSVFVNSSYVAAGIAGFNLGGLIKDSTASFTLVKSSSSSFTAGGIVGRNVYGYVKDVSFDGQLLAYFTGGIIGSNYNYSLVAARSSGSGSLSAESLAYTVPTDSFNYTDEDGTVITDTITDSSISLATLNYWFSNMTSFYYYAAAQNSFSQAIRYLKVLGMAVGLSYTDSDVVETYYYNTSSAYMVVNPSSASALSGVTVGNFTATLVGGYSYNLPYSNIITSISGLDYTYVLYPVGYEASSYDSWTRAAYASERVVFTGSNITTSGDDNDIYSISFSTYSRVYVKDDANAYTIEPSGDTYSSSEAYTLRFISDDGTVLSLANINDYSITSGNESYDFYQLATKNFDSYTGVTTYGTLADGGNLVTVSLDDISAQYSAIHIVLSGTKETSDTYYMLTFN